MCIVLWMGKTFVSATKNSFHMEWTAKKRRRPYAIGNMIRMSNDCIEKTKPKYKLNGEYQVKNNILCILNQSSANG